MYRYDTQNLLKNSESYQMTEFEGSKFLFDYIKSRNEIFSMISSKKTITKFTELQDMFTTEFRVINKKDLFTRDIVTNELFIFLLNSTIRSTQIGRAHV